MTAAEKAYRTSSDNIEERNELITRELPQVYYVAARIRERLPQHVEMEDLVHAGVIGLIEAYRSYDKSKNAGFSTFAKFRVRGAILDSLRELDWGSRTLRKKGRQIASAITTLATRLGRQPQQEEIAAELQMSLQDLHTTLTELDALYIVGQHAESSDDPSATFDLIESAPSRGGDNPFEIYLEGESRAHLAEAVAELTEREQLILQLYYYEELTMREIAEVVGVAVSRVSQIHTGALLQLRTRMAAATQKAAVKPTLPKPKWRSEQMSTFRSHA